jgi:hypothetical protein
MQPERYNNHISQKDCLLLFVKSPVKGRVKSRLAVSKDGDFEVQLYRYFVEDTISLVENLDVHLKVCFYPPGARADLSRWLGERRCYSPQSGDNLGDRLRNAFAGAFEEGFSSVVAIGSDIPDLPLRYLTEGFEALTVQDVVIGPAGDGGYYLIGFSKDGFTAELFDNISWSTDGVFEQSMNILKRHGRKTHQLPLWYDVDTIEDLKSLLSRARNTTFEKSRTYSYLTADRSWNKNDT